MTITIPYELGDKITTNSGTEANIRSLHVYIDEKGNVSNVRAFTGRETGYTTLLKTHKE